MKISVNVKSLGARRASVNENEFELPCTPQDISTVKDFLDAVTEVCVVQYKKRQSESEILKVLSADQIDEKSLSGKISFGVNYGTKSPDVIMAKENTRQCYLDGIFSLFIDGKEISGEDKSLPLETSLEIHEGSNVTFIRLTMLAGRMW